MNFFLTLRKPLLMTLLVCPAIKASILEDFFKPCLTGRALLGAAAGFGAGVAANTVDIEKRTGGTITAARVASTVAHTAVSVAIDEVNSPKNPAVWLRYFLPAVASEVGFASKVGQEIINLTPGLNIINRHMPALASYLVFRATSYAAGQTLDARLGIKTRSIGGTAGSCA